MSHIEQNCTQLLFALKSCAAALKTAFDEIADPTARQVIDRKLEAASAAITDFEQALAAQPAVQDADGENKAVRSFLMLYGQPGLTVGQMKKHMVGSGFTSWPEWVETEPHGAHLTKAGAQLWIRHLFALEVAPPAQPAFQEPVYLVEDDFGLFRITTKGDWNFYNVTVPGVKKTLIANATPPAAQPAAQSCYCPNCEALTKELAALKERPAVQREWCNGRGVLAGHAQDGSFDGEDCPHCAPPAQTAPVQPVGRVCFGGDEVVWTDEPPESGALLYTTPPAQSAPESGSWYAAKEMDEMVRDLDAALNGDGAAPQAKLCDLMPQLIQRLTAQPAPEQYTALEQALTRLQKRYAELEAKVAAQPAVPLTDEQILALWEDTYVQRGSTGIEFARAIEAAHGITEKAQS